MTAGRPSRLSYYGSVEIIGLAAGALTTVSFLPQMLRIWRTRSARDISYGALLTFIAGVALWLLYGLQIHSEAIVLANGVTLGLNLSILALKIRHHEAH
ncbi:MAG TPA: SemiSWEET transporter [Candidatus Aquilonibacter sp.]|nr:SemiSWEET transporter [Candidatus Aquilonibacter sp.]